MDDDYRRRTREAYRSPEKALAYDRQLRGLTWMRFAMWRETRAVRAALQACGLGKGARILDLPCGTGLLGELLARERCNVVGADISLDMIRLALPHYGRGEWAGFVNADIVALPFATDSFDCAIVIGLFHRLPADIRAGALASLKRVCRGPLIVSFSLDSPVRRLKLFVLRLVRPRFSSAPSPAPLAILERELANAGWRIARRWAVAPILSSESVFVLHPAESGA
jgi:ubiquinone/menaquinone biosynthesis C-methylase UbiE